MKTSGKKIVSQGSVYFIGNVLRHSISFIMLPVYTRMLTPADYGTVELLSMVIDFAGIIFGMRIGEAIFRFYSMEKIESEKKSIISTSMILSFVLNCAGFLFLFSISAPLSMAIFGSLDNQSLLSLFALSLLFMPLTEIPMTFIRAQQRPYLFVTFSSIKMTLQLSLNIYLIVYMNLGVKGVVLSAVFTGAIMALVLGGYCLRQVGLKFSRVQARALAVFSYPLILTSLISFYITFGDRYFLKLYGTLDDVGVYALGYKFGFLLSFIGTGPFFSIWDSERYNVLNGPNAKENFQNIFLFFTAFVSLMVVMISVFSKNVLMVMANPEFWGAAKIVPVILLAYFLQGWTGFCNLGILIEKKTFIITKSTVLAAVLITFLYMALIPAYGALGAAWATVLTFAVRFLYIHWQAKKLYDMELPWRKVSSLFPACFVAIMVSLFGPEDIVWSFSLNVVVVYMLFYFTSFNRNIPLNQRIVFRKLLLRPWGMVQEFRLFIKSV